MRQYNSDSRLSIACIFNPARPRARHFLVTTMIALCLVTLHLGANCQRYPERNYLVNELNQAGEFLSPGRIAEWRKAEKTRYIEKISLLPDSVKNFLITKASEALSYKWPALPATSYLEYKQKGIRTGFEKLQDERREMLNRLVIGELVSGKGEFIPQVLNGLWTTLEESSWEIPAIIGLQQAGTDLPDPSEHIIGLVSAETGLMVASIQFMLYDQLKRISPMIHKRIDAELSKRILQPYLRRNDFWWMGFRGQAVNNWNVWINANVLNIACLNITDTDTLSLLMRKVFASTDFFINQCPADGGSEEGPAYWNLAGGKLIRLLSLSHRLSNGRLDWGRMRLLHDIGAYIEKVHIRDDYFVNFADATPQTMPSAASVYRYGEMFNDDTLRHFSSYLYTVAGRAMPYISVVEFLEMADVYASLVTGKSEMLFPSFTALRDLQVFTVRATPASSSSTFLAIQGGNNGESHNHNDIGNFILYARGEPVIIDAGVGTYNSKTFSDRRYEIWNMQSQWHNCPLINGAMQRDGSRYKPAGVVAIDKEDCTDISMDIAGAYPESARVNSWIRTIHFDKRKGLISLAENFSLKEKSGETSLSFLSRCNMKTTRPGIVEFFSKDGTLMLTVKYPAGKMTARVEEKILDDQKLITAWGDRLFRLTLVLTSYRLKDSVNLGFIVPASR